MNIDKIKKIIVIFFQFLVGIYFILYFPFERSELYKNNYIILIICYFFINLLLAYRVLKKGIYIFEPILMVTILYLGIFTIRPMMDIINYKTSKYGIDTSEGCMKATLIFMLGYFSFFIGYYFNFSKKHFFKIKNSYFKDLDIKKRKKIVQFNLLIWVISFILVMTYFLYSGYSVIYILTAGKMGTASINDSNATLGFLSNFSIVMVTSWMYILIFSRSNILKLLLYFILIVHYVVKGGRAMLIVALLTPLVYFYVSKKKKPPILLVAILFFLVVIMSTIMQYARWGIRSGGAVAVEIPKLELETLLAPFNSDLTTYKTFYGMVINIPEKMNFLYGRQMFLYTAIMFIPRILWSGKPEPQIRKVLEVSMNKLANISGEAYPNIGEYYVEFGVLGVIVLMFFFGWFCKQLKILYRKGEKKSHAMILYAVLYSLLLQLTIRGFTPSNFYIFILAILPCYLTRRILKSN